MAIDFNTVKMLFWAKNTGAAFTRTLTLGHQGLVCSPRLFRNAVRNFRLPISQQDTARCFQAPPFSALYADEVFRALGAKTVTSVDRSDFEGASYLHDLNERFPEDQRGTYDFVFDGGTLEHIFDYPGALRNTLELVAPGGHFLTMSPANNLMGHGFYQISPELLFRVFNGDSGFVLRKIILHDVDQADAVFYEVRDPAITGRRNNLRSSKALQVAALAQRVENVPVLTRPPQQSDYVAHWEHHRKATTAAPTPPSGPLSRIRTALNPYWPHWLREYKRKWVVARQMGSDKLSNPEHYRRLSNAEIWGDRQGTGS